MPIDVACVCGATFKAPDSAAGRRARCKRCGETVTIPSLDEPYPIVLDDPPPPEVAAPALSTGIVVESPPLIAASPVKPIAPPLVRPIETWPMKAVTWGAWGLFALGALYGGWLAWTAFSEFRYLSSITALQGAKTTVSVWQFLGLLIRMAFGLVFLLGSALASAVMFRIVDAVRQLRMLVILR